MSILHICGVLKLHFTIILISINLPLRKDVLIFFTIEFLMVTETLSFLFKVGKHIIATGHLDTIGRSLRKNISAI